MLKRISSPALTAALIAIAAILAMSCGPGEVAPVEGLKAFTGARLIDATDNPPIANAVLVVRDGRIEAVGPLETVPIPEGAEQVDVSGRIIIPGIINTHGHVGNTIGLESGHFSEENVLRHLRLYARYGITTVNSLGDDQEASFRIRDAQDTPDLDRARLYAAGTVITEDTPEDARRVVDEMAALKADFIKFRVDDNLGRTEKMSPEVYEAIIDQADKYNLPVAVHIHYLEDAKSLLRAGMDFVGHSIRDQEVDDELIELMLETGACQCPTLTREVSTFIYEDAPEFFTDPFFLKEFDPAVFEPLKDPERQKRVKESRSAQLYKIALEVASRNVKKLADGGVKIAFGTDSGPPGRFQGYFEHMELELMVEAGLTPRQVLISATADAAACIGLTDLGTLEPGKWADFIVLSEDPLTDIKNMRSIESVCIAGNRVPDKEQS